MNAVLPEISVDDARLISDTRVSFPDVVLADLTADGLAHISSEYGLDFATALAFDCVKRDRRAIYCAESIHAVLNGQRQTTPLVDAVFCLVPNLGYFVDERSKAAGDAMLDAASRLGFDTLVIHTSHDADLGTNARRVVEGLASASGRTIVVASISIGSGIFKIALQRCPWHRSFGGVRAWLNICGLLDGTPVGSIVADSHTADVQEHANNWFAARGDLFVRQMLASLAECARGPGRRLAHPLQLPPRVKLLNVIPFPLARHFRYLHTKLLRKAIGQFGPNDGLGLLADMLNQPGELFPIWGSDHYLDLHVDVPRLTDALLKCVAAKIGLIPGSHTASPSHL